MELETRVRLNREELEPVKVAWRSIRIYADPDAPQLKKLRKMINNEPLDAVELEEAAEALRRLRTVCERQAERHYWETAFGLQEGSVDLDCPACGEPVKSNWEECPDCGAGLHVEVPLMYDPAQMAGVLASARGVQAREADEAHAVLRAAMEVLADG